MKNNNVIRFPGRRPSPSFHLFLIAVILTLILVPFLNKAFHIDDTLFIWSAKKIITDPLDFYGFIGNWAGFERPAPDIIKNPPLASYYLALVASAAGWSERALHMAFIIPSIAAALGAYFLARKFVRSTLAASLIGIMTPVFAVSSTTVMCDVMMLAFWNWAIVLWVRGVERDEKVATIAASVLVALSALTKYFGISLIPLLAVYALVFSRRSTKHIIWLIIPVALLAGYHFYTEALYGRGLLLDASAYATNIRAEGGGFVEKTLIGLVFTGGSMITALFFAPFVWRARVLIGGAIATVALAIVLTRFNALGGAELITEGGLRWGLIIQLAVFAAAGVHIIALTVAEYLREKDPPALLLLLWIFGTFIFAVFVNWTINGRTILPMAPAIGILLARNIESRYDFGLARLIPALIPGLAITMLVAWADYRHANSARSVATEIMSKYPASQSTVWFEGHWGFQYYMEGSGAKAIDWRKSRIARGDIIVFPFNNTGLRFVPEGKTELIEDLSYTTIGFLTAMSLGPGAGFYAGEWGPLPFMFGRVNDERYQVMRSLVEFTFD